MADSDVAGLFTYLIKEFGKKHIAFLEVNEGADYPGAEITPFMKANPAPPFTGNISHFCKSLWTGPFMANNGYTFESGNQSLLDGKADMVSFGNLFLANADLVKKFETGKRLNDVRYVKDMSKMAEYLYMNGPIGYTDLSVYEPPAEATCCSIF